MAVKNGFASSWISWQGNASDFPSDDRCFWSFRGHSSIPCAVMMFSTAFPLPAGAIFQKYPFYFLKRMLRTY